jgi:hypothetical protein
MSLSSLLGLTRSQPTQIVPASISEPKIAEEIAPYLKDILGKGQALYKQRMDEGFVPYEGKTLAAISDDQTTAQAGLRELVGQSKPIYDEASGLIRGQTQQATTENLQPFMNPYQQAVTDIAKRQATEQFEQQTLPGLRKSAIDAGSFGGSRAAMLESQARDNQARLLSDLQAKGDLAAFQNAQKQFEAQKLRERQAASGLSSLVPQQFTSQARELGALEAMGREQQQREQTLLDESYKRFLTEREFPEQQLGKFQALVAGTPINQGQVQYTQQQYRPSPLATALGTGATALGTYDAAKNLKLFSEGGSIDGGLSGLPVVKKKIGQSIFSNPTTPAQMADINEEIEEYDEEDGPSTIDSLKQFFNSLQNINVGGKNLASKGPPLDKFISTLPERISKVGKALNPLRTTEKQKQRAVEFEGKINRMKRDKKFVEDGEPGLDEFKEQQDRYTTLKNILDTTPVDNTSSNNSSVNNQSVTNNNPSVNKQNQELISGDIIGNARPGTGDTTEFNPYDAVRKQFTNLAQQYAGLEATAKAQGEADKARLTEEKETARKAARSKFLIDLGKGLLTGDGKGGGFFAEFGKAGAKATEGSQEYLKTLKDLNREERQIVRDSANQQFQARVGKYQQLLNQGKIDIDEYTTGLEQMRLNHAAKDKVLKTGLTITEQADNYLASTEDGRNPNVGYENYLKIRYLLEPSQQKAYDARFKAIFDENPNKEEFKVNDQR